LRLIIRLASRYPPLYIALGTGFCGSITTFSTFIVQAFQAFSNQRHFNRHGFHNVIDALTQTFLTFGMSLIAYYAGAKLKDVLDIKYMIHHIERHTVHKTVRRRWQTSGEENGQIIDADTNLPYTTTVDLVHLVAGIIFYAGAAILCGTKPPFRRVTYGLIMAPPGTILRWYFSRLNSIAWSKRGLRWPLGTLTANLLATALYCAVFVGQNYGRPPLPTVSPIPSSEVCDVLFGVQNGFCGCLSTISTFAVELSNIKPRRCAVGYAIGSYMLGMIICILVIGAPWWVAGMDGSCSSI
jgi:fluoride ion exporter CrcB/FEX